MNPPHPASTRKQAPAGCPVCTIIPSHMLRHLSQNGPARLRKKAFQTLQHSERLRGQRDMLACLGAVTAGTPTGAKRRTVYDLAHGTLLPGRLVRGEGGPKSRDVQINEAYDYSGDTYDFFSEVFGRNSIDNRGMRIDHEDGRTHAITCDEAGASEPLLQLLYAMQNWERGVKNS